MTRKALLVLLVALLGACGDSDRKDPQVGPAPMPADEDLDCLTHFESSYTFTRNLLMTG